MISRLGMIALVVSLFPSPAAAVEVYLTPLNLIDDASVAAPAPLRPEADLTRAMIDLGAGNIVDLQPADPGQTSDVRSLLDASRLCQSNGYSLLLYGFVKRSALSFAAEVKLFDADKGSVAASFFASDDSGHYDRLMQDLAERIRDYFAAATGPRTTLIPRDPERNLLILPVALGYWTPAGGGWNQVLAGLGSASLGFRFMPSRPLFTFLSRQWVAAFGMDADYQLGMNQPGFESSFLHSLHLRIPVECSIELSQGHLIGAGVGALLVVDILSQDRLYSSPYLGATTAPGLSASVMYRYEASGGVTVGCSTILDVAFYTPPLVTVSPRIFLEFTPGRLSTRGHP
jgi:hypothetical protein